MDWATVNRWAANYHDISGSSPQAGWGLTNTGPFSNIQLDYYWSATEYAAYSGCAWASTSAMATRPSRGSVGVL